MKRVYLLTTRPYWLWLVVLFLFFTDAITTHAQVKGVVFRDFDLNGIRSDTLPIEMGIPGVVVLAFVDQSSTPISTTTTADGSYAFSSTDVPAGKSVRVEFRNFPSGDYNGPYGTGSGTSVQFTKAPTDNINLGINYPADYCQRYGANLVVPVYVNGNTQLTTDQNGDQVPDDKQTAKSSTLVSIPYVASGVANSGNFPLTTLAKAEQLGAVWGLAYQRRSQKLLSAATVKRHMSFGPLGTGGIYITDMSTGTTSSFIDLKTLGIDTGDDPHSNLFGDKTQASIDPGPMTAMGRMSIGGIELSEDDKTLYLINLKDKKLYSIFIDSPARIPTTADVKSWAIPDPGCSNGDFRPWAVKVNRGKVYIGVVCSAETSQQQSDLRATVYRFDPTAATPSFDELLSFPLDFRRGPADGTFDPLNPDKSCKQYDHWLPWTEAWPETCGLGQNPTFVMLPQPILSSLSFDDDGSLLIGFMDRFGYLSGWANHDPQGNGLYNGFTAGDLLRAYNDHGVFVLESNGKAGDRTGSGVGNNEGPGGGEFYGKDEWFFINQIAHSEVTNGSSVIIPGYNEVISSAYDPIANVFQSAGLKVFNNTNGQSNRNYVIYTQLVGSFGKAGGIGDVAALCDAAPIEIGNRLWFDDNRDGIQDAYEPGIDGIVLTLHDMQAGGTQIATQTTHDGGQYYFNNSTVPGGLQFGHHYEIRMDTTQLSLLDITLAGTKPITPPAAGGRVAARGARQAATPQRNYVLSPANRGNFTDPDFRDSNAQLVGGSAVIPVTTLDAGQNDFTNDLSIYSCPQLTNVKDIVAVCTGTPLDSIAAVGNYFSRVDSVRFVLFTSPQSGTAMYSNSGTVLGTVKPDANNRAALYNPAVNTTNNTASVSRQYIYAIIYPTPENPACRQSGETVIEITPSLSVTASGGGLNCITKEVTLKSQAIYGDGTAASKVIYSWTGPNSFTSSLQNPVVSETGTYTVTVSSIDCPNAFTTATAQVNADTQKPVLEAYGAAIPCKGCSATLFADAPGATLFWTGPSSFTSTQAEPEVTLAGNYTVVATGVNGCTVDMEVEVQPVIDDPCPPLSITALGGKLTCSVVSVTLAAQASLLGGSTPPNVVYAWTGPNSFTSSAQNPSVSVPGDYTVTAHTLDCPDIIATTTVTVTADTALPVLEASGAALPCKGCSATLYANAPGATLLWSGPNGFSSTLAEPEVTIAGDYTVVAMGVNGCTVDKTVSLLPAICLPLSVTGTGGQLTCTLQSVTVTAQASLTTGTTVSSAIYRWVGPANFSSGSQNPVVSLPGTYTVITYNQDCPDILASTTVVVTQDASLPDLQAHGATLPCKGCSATLVASTNGVTLRWSGPNNFTSTSAETVVTEVGSYTVVATGINGCTADRLVSVLPFPCPPLSITATGGKLTCSVLSVTLSALASLQDGTVPPNLVYKWTGPASFTSSSQNPDISVPGNYTVTAHTLDCPDIIASTTVVVTTDITEPVLEAYGAAIPCKGCSATLYADAPGATLLWSGPNGFSSTLAEPEVTIAGDYTVVATGVNGCKVDMTVEVQPPSSDPCPPLSITATGGKLTCSVVSVTLTAQAGSLDGLILPNVIYAWTGPHSFTSSAQNPSVSLPGNYTVTAHTLDCPDVITATTVAVVADTIKPVLEAFGAAIPCKGCSATLFADAPGATLLWSGPNGFSSTEAEPVVTLAGDYTVVATGGNGCKIDMTVEVSPPGNDDPCTGRKPICLPLQIRRVK